MKQAEKNLSEFRTPDNTNILALDGEMRVADLESGFLSIYGLVVQVLRKSGKVWLETTLTDNWTLNEQNKQGEALSRGNYSTEL
jgi:hypothetical protein